VRGRLDQSDGRFDLELRLRTALLRIEAPALQTLGATDDPEGTSLYRAGRAELTAGDQRLPGWLVTEETPADRPRRAYVDYGDFAFTVVAAPDRVALAKGSRARPSFDHRLVSTLARSAGEGRGADMPAAAGALLDQASVLATDRTRGTAPGGRPVRYDVLLLGGAVHGVSFAIRPENQE
jgi:hypothetical protein